MAAWKTKKSHDLRINFGAAMSDVERLIEELEALFVREWTEQEVWTALHVIAGTVQKTIPTLRELAAKLQSAEQEKAEAVAQRDRLKPNHYPHMCRDGHPQIGHADNSSEMCPVCRVAAERDEAVALVRYVSRVIDIGEVRAFLAAYDARHPAQGSSDGNKSA
jgi:hypothetical protein